MDTSKPATGFQIAFLAFAVELFIAISVARIAAAIGWPPEKKEQLGQLLTMLVAAAALFSIPSLRRFSIAQLQVPLARSTLLEVSVVAVSKLALPFAISGALVIWATAVDTNFDFYKRLPLHENASELRSSAPLWMAILYFAMSWLIAPIIEELLFRGVLYRAWERQWGWVRAMLLTSTVFAIGHPSHMTSSFIASILFVCVLRRTQTLWGPILVHGAFNILVFIPPYGEWLYVKPKAEAALLSSWTFEFACLAFVLVALPAYIGAARKPDQSPALRTHVSA